MKIVDKKIAFVLYNYPLGVSTMIINTIAMLKENGNQIFIISNNDQAKDLPCEPWLNALFVGVAQERKIDKLKKFIINNNILFFLAKIAKKIFKFIFKKTAKNLTWEEKNLGILEFAQILKAFFFNNKIDIVVPIECFSLIAVDMALKETESKPEVVYFDMELLDWTPENPLYSDKLELKQRQADALKRVNHVAITSFNRAKIFSKINQFSEVYISVLPVVPRARKIETRSNYFRKKFNISNDKLIVLYSGNFMPWAQCLEIIKSVKYWPQNVELVMHTWNKGSLKTDYFEEMRLAASGLPIYFSSDYLVYEDLCLALSSADVGLLYYAEIDDNFTEICFSSNKMGEYLASGMPIICSPLPSLKKFVEENGVGFAVSFEEIGQAISDIKKEQELFRKRVKVCCDKYFIFDQYFNKAFQNFRQVSINN